MKNKIVQSYTMFDKSSVLIYLVFLIMQKSTLGEWVDIPQFSDEAKVYRLPFTKYEPGQKYFLDNRDGPKMYEYGNFTGNNFRRIFNQHHAADKTTESMPSQSADIITTTENSFLTDDREIVVSESIRDNEDYTEETFIEDEASATVSTVVLDDKIIVDQDEPHEAMPDENQTEQETAEPEIEENEESTSFLAYIPIELFKKVHAILKSQSPTAEGKINFLKRFERTLLAEIEKRLVPVISPVREKRESRGDHGWDDHHDSVGFPSLEGTLMAISFLTFAVYLVQLVMTLFRNLGNNTANMPGTATILFPNRNKRSTNYLTEDTARILDYLDDFVKKSTY